MSQDRIESILQILACPESKQPLRRASASELAEVNRLIDQGSLANRIEVTISDPVEGLLVRQDGRYAYPIRNGIPIMLVEEAIPLQK